MCAKRLYAATALAAGLALATGAPAMAWPFGGKSAKPEAAKTAAAKPDAKTAAPAATPIRKADAAERAAAERLDPLGAAAFWAREAQIDPTDAEAGLRLSQALRTIGRYEEAAQSAQTVLVTAPNNVDALLALARARIGDNQGFFAIEPLQKAQTLKPRDWRSATLLAIAYEQSQRLDEAKAAHELALSLAPDTPAVLANAALFRAGQGDRDGAEVMLRRAVAQPTSTARERQNLALVLGLQGKMAEAEKLIRQDLPPQAAEENLAYLKAATAPGAQSRR